MNIRYLAALAAILFSALPSQAQTNVGWDTRFWPASNSPPRIADADKYYFQSDIITSQIVFAVDERILAAYSQTTGGDVFAPPLLASLYYSNKFVVRKHDEVLAAAKASLSVWINAFVNHTQTNSGLISPTNYVNWTVEDILNYCELPEDFFDFTPVRNLAGNTNAAIESFSKGQDYGWDAMRRVITNLIYTARDANFFTSEYGEKCFVIIDQNEGVFQEQVDDIESFDYPGQFKETFVANQADVYRFNSGYKNTTFGPQAGYQTTFLANDKIYDAFSFNSNLIINTKAEIWERFISEVDEYYPQDGDPYTECAGDVPNSQIAFDFEQSCETNSLWYFTSTITNNVIYSNSVYSIAQNKSDFTIPICSALSLANLLSCYFVAPDFDFATVYGCDEDQGVGIASQQRRASTRGFRQYFSFINWGFTYK